MKRFLTMAQNIVGGTRNGHKTLPYMVHHNILIYVFSCLLQDALPSKKRLPVSDYSGCTSGVIKLARFSEKSRVLKNIMKFHLPLAVHFSFNNHPSNYRWKLIFDFWEKLKITALPLTLAIHSHPVLHINLFIFLLEIQCRLFV